MLKKVLSVTHFLLILNFVLIDGLESQNKYQRHNPNTDFLQHEAGAVPTSRPKQDHVVPAAPSSNPTEGQRQQSFGQDFDSQFPPLGSTPITQRSTGKRDYVAHTRENNANIRSRPSSLGNQNYDAQFPSLNSRTTNPVSSTKSTGKRDYVSPTNRNTANNPSRESVLGNKNYNAQFPPLGSQSTKPVSLTTTSGKRDYVSPNFYSTSSPAPSTSNKVKDLINFYDNKNKDNNNKGTSPGYSAILQNKNKQNIVPNVSKTTKKPSTSPQRSSSRPSSPVLPSSLVSNQGNSADQVSDDEIKILSEELLRKDVNNAAKYITVNYQSKTSSSSTEDKAPQPLLAVAADAWNIPTIKTFIPLLDNYERDTLVNEYVTPQERNEENAFMDAIMSTTVIRHLMNFLKEKGYVSPDPKQQRDFLKQLWFSLYSRGKGKISSSGFEHIFVSELKNGEVSGLHNWIYFSKEESANRVNYLGYLKYLELNNKGVVIKLHFNQLGVDKPVDTMFIGTSPELEIALYTLCFVTRADAECNLKLGANDVNIVTHTFRYRSKNLIGSAYPQF